MADNIKKLTPNAAQTKIREIAKFGDVILTSHCLLDSMRTGAIVFMMLI